MIVLLGILLGALLFFWANEWLGLIPAVCVLVLYTLEPNVAAHATLVTTDLGVTCFMFGTVYFLWRVCRRRTVPDLAGLALCFALAIVTKFSAVLLAPIVVLLLLLATRRHGLSVTTATGLMALVTAAAFVAIWTVYGFRYSPSASPGWLFDLHRPETASDPELASLAGWIDFHRLLPNAFTEGFLYSFTSVKGLGGFLAGDYSVEGWWYYFPFAFLIKTPLALLALLAVGVFAFVRRRDVTWSTAPFVMVPIVVYMSVSMATGVNVGLRHILPIYPFVLLIAAAAVKELVTGNRTARLVAAGIGLAAAAEFAAVYPHNLTFFNQLAGGPDNGFRYLTDSNLGWGQNLKPLKTWMDRNRIAHVNLAYFGQADPAYYEIDCTYLPGSPTFAQTSIARPRLPGYVAISSTVLSGVYLQPHLRLLYAPFRNLEPVAVIGNSIRVYWVERWPDTTGPEVRVADVEDHRILGDALLYGMRWPTRAVRHYLEYLTYHPNQTETLLNAAVALSESDQPDQSLAMLQRAVDADPDSGEAHFLLARVLAARANFDAAALHAARATALRPDDPVAHDLLGRIRAVQGDAAQAEDLFLRALELDPTYQDARAHLREIRRAASR
jgi:tetratricopeptide (TPR) repeat protein